MSENKQAGVLIVILVLLLYAVTYWSLQPTCAPNEIRVRGFFMTHCVAGR